jgi:hypothetical protein
MGDLAGKTNTFGPRPVSNPRRGIDMKFRLNVFSPLSLVAVLLLFCFCVAAFGQEAASETQAPELIKTTPAIASPGTAINLEGLRMGAEADDRIRIYFVQSGVEHPAEKTGSSWDSNDVKRGLQHYNVKVPKDVEDGPCQIIVEVAGVRSLPQIIEIKTLVKPPVLNSLNPRWVLRGEVVWIDGSGFGDDDEVELIDSTGETHELGNLGTTSSALTAAFTLPENLPDGEATIRAIEQRSGLKQPSNSLAFMISHDPVPLYIHEDALKPVAPGQWLQLVVTSMKPLERADRIEVRMKQNEAVSTATVKDVKNLRVQVPMSFVPGLIEIETRTWVAQTPSAWSKPVSLKLIERTASAQISDKPSP